MLLGTELNGATEELLNAFRRRLGFIFQAHNLHDSLTAMQNVRMGLEVHGAAAMRDWRDAAAHVLTTLGLRDRLDYLPAKLSGGQKQRVAVARALNALIVSWPCRTGGLWMAVRWVDRRYAIHAGTGRPLVRRKSGLNSLL